jgi:hypothetical protein
MNETKSSNLWWPTIATVEDAGECAKLGVVLLCAVVTAALAVSALAGYSFLGVTPWSLADAGIFCLLAFGISRKSKSAALLAPAFYLGERVYAWTNSGVPSTFGGILALIFLVSFINSARGVFAFHRLGKGSDSAGQVA